MGTDAVHAFMNAVLGEDATNALMKAGERSESLAEVIGPRTVVGWVNLASRWNYDGFIPGHEDSLLRFEKNESGLTGVIALGEQQLDFENAQPEHLAAMLCVGLGCPPDLKKSEGATGIALAQLGDSIDLMVKAQVARLLKAEDSKERLCPDCGGTSTPSYGELKCTKCGSHFRREPRKRVLPGSETEKAELPGKAAAPQAPDAPQGQDAPTAKAPRRMAQRPASQVRLTKSMVERKCSVCESTQFTKSGELKGCFCLRDLARFAKSERDGDSYLVTFGSEWSKNQVKLFLDIVGGKEE